MLLVIELSLDEFLEGKEKLEGKFLTLNNPSLKDAANFLARYRAYYTTIIYANCEASYRGRSRAELDRADRLIIVKPDGTVLVHEGKKREPINWQPPGSRTSYRLREDVLVLRSVRDRPREELEIYLYAIYFILMAKLGVTGIEIEITEKKLVEYAMKNPEIIEEGFRPIRTEVQTPFGFIDLLGEDKERNLVIIEFKRITAQVEAVYQLMRYVDFMKSNTGRTIRGILAAPKATDSALIMLKRYGLEFRKIPIKKIFHKD